MCVNTSRELNTKMKQTTVARSQELDRTREVNSMQKSIRAIDTERLIGIVIGCGALSCTMTLT